MNAALAAAPDDFRVLRRDAKLNARLMNNDLAIAQFDRGMGPADLDARNRDRAGLNGGGGINARHFWVHHHVHHSVLQNGGGEGEGNAELFVFDIVKTEPLVIVDELNFNAVPVVSEFHVQVCA